MTTSLPRTAEENARRVHVTVEPLARASANQAVFLVDGDRTLSPDDTSRTLAARAGIDHAAIKRRFQRDGYVFDAFRFHAEAHLGMDAATFDRLSQQVADHASLHHGAVEFLTAAAQRGRVFVVSAGIPRIWSWILQRHGLHNIGVVGGVDPVNPFVFGRAEKGQVAAIFRRHATTLVGVGDSDVDAEMLRQSDHAVVVVNHHQNIDLMPALLGHRSVWQVAPLGQRHSGIRTLTFPKVATLSTLSQSGFTEVQACP